MNNRKYIAYFRVSTKRQGQSGLGLEGQHEAVRRHVASGDWTKLGAFTDIESGKNNDRPELMKALALTKLTGATLVIAKLDRLSRDAHFLLGLEKAGVDFVATDMPNANRLTVRLMAVIAQEEREMISARTKDALAAAKARGKQLGGWRGGPLVESKLGREAQARKADEFAASIRPMVIELRAAGLVLQQIADELTAKSIKTARGGSWTPASVRAIALRAA